MFIEYNANPFGAYIGDCIIRAITKATNKNYMDVMDGLIAVADKHDWEIDELRTMNVYLLSIGWEYCELNCKPTVKQFASAIMDPRILIVNEHATCTQDGNVYDTWNCSRYRVKHVYRKHIDE